MGAWLGGVMLMLVTSFYARQELSVTLRGLLLCMISLFFPSLTEKSGAYYTYWCSACFMRLLHICLCPHLCQLFVNLAIPTLLSRSLRCVRPGRLLGLLQACMTQSGLPLSHLGPHAMAAGDTVFACHTPPFLQARRISADHNRGRCAPPHGLLESACLTFVAMSRA